MSIKKGEKGRAKSSMAGFGERLRALRAAKGWSLDQLASETGISRAYLWKLEKKPGGNPSLKRMGVLAEALDATVGQLAGDIESLSVPGRSLPSRPVQIQSASHPGDQNCGPHTQIFALCEDGSIWVHYFSSGSANVPSDGLWHMIQPPDDRTYISQED